LVLTFPERSTVFLGLIRHDAFFAGKPTSYWIHALKQARPAGDVGKTLREGGSAAVAVLCEIAEDPDDNVRSEALRGLSLMGTEARAAMPVLAVTIKREKNSGRFLLASETLAKLDPAAAAHALAWVLSDKQDAGRRAWALTELAKLAPKGQEALPVLNDLVGERDEDVRLRVQAIQVLRRLNQPAEPLVSSLCDILNVGACPVGVQALEVLGEMGPDATPALPTLVKLLEQPTLPLVGRRWGPPHRAAVIRTLGAIGPGACAAVPLLIAALQHDNYFLRTEIALALAHMGPPAREALAARDAASWTSIALLGAQPPANSASLPLVERMKRSWIPVDVPTREAAHQAILQIDPRAAARAGVR